MDKVAEELVRLAEAHWFDELESQEDIGNQIPPSPIDGFTKQKARRYIQKYLGNHPGFYRDNWGEVDRIFENLRDSGGLNVSGWAKHDAYHKNGYFRSKDDGHISGKAWEFEVTFLNEKGKPTSVKGTIVASFAGSVEQRENDYLGEDRPYDISAYVY